MAWSPSLDTLYHSGSQTVVPGPASASRGNFLEMQCSGDASPLDHHSWPLTQESASNKPLTQKLRCPVESENSSVSSCLLSESSSCHPPRDQPALEAKTSVLWLWGNTKSPASGWAKPNFLVWLSSYIICEAFVGWKLKSFKWEGQ